MSWCGGAIPTSMPSISLISPISTDGGRSGNSCRNRVIFQVRRESSVLTSIACWPATITVNSVVGPIRGRREPLLTDNSRVSGFIRREKLGFVQLPSVWFVPGGIWFIARGGLVIIICKVSSPSNFVFVRLALKSGIVPRMARRVFCF